MADPHPFSELSTSGILWLINRTVFHPRGLALSMTIDDDGTAIGWDLIGSGKEVITFNEQQDDRGFARALATLEEALHHE